MIRFTNNFVKITAWPLQKIIFNTKIHYEDKAVQSRKIKGPAIIISNHTSIFDYAVLLFVFFTRTIRCQMAEVLFKQNPFLTFLLKNLGGIKVDREARNFNFVYTSEKILKKKGLILVYPESRLPLPEEERPLEFKPSVTFLALSAQVPVIPVYTDGNYFCRKRANVIIGKPVNLAEFYDNSKTRKENILNLTLMLRQKVISLKEIMDTKLQKQKAKAGVKK